MEQELIFRNQLMELIKTAKKQGMCITKAQVLESFPTMDLSQERLELIYDYLKNSKIVIGEREDYEELLTETDKDYLQQYLEEIELFAEVDEQQRNQIYQLAMQDQKDAIEKLVRIFLPKVVTISRLYAGQGAYLEDLIGEGNVALTVAASMVSCLETTEEVDGFLGKMIMDAMEQYINEELSEEEMDGQVLETLNKILLVSTELSELMRRKVTVSELSKETGYTEQQIEEALLICGNQIETIELINE